MAAAKKRTASEIDDIFSAKPSKAAASSTAAAKPAAASTSAPAGTANAGGAAAAKKKGKKAAAAGAAGQDTNEATAASPTAAAAAPPKRVPETIVDTSKAIEYYKPEPLVPKPLRDNATDEERKAAEEDERFMDSRGTRKKTEDGLPIYSLDELNIGHGGDTPECPFDCQCCF